MEGELDEAVYEPATRIVHGRGAQENPSGRFESISLEPDPEWEAEDSLRTQYFKDTSKAIVSFNDSPDVGITASVNPYRGCEHGCIYCYARPTHEYLGLSCGLDFESKIFAKMEAPQLLREALLRKSWKPQPVAFSGVTDPYQPVERKLKLTRQCLEVLAEFNNPVGIITKNYTVTRDIDILSRLAGMNAVCVFVSITSLDDEIARVMEPRASSPSMRLKAVQELSQAGIPVGVMMGPVVPGLTDHEIDGILQAASQAGARTAGYTMLRLPYGVKDLFQTWLSVHFPSKKDRVLNRIRDVRNGNLNDYTYGRRMVGEGTYAEYISNMFALAKKRHGLTQAIGPLSVEAFSTAECKQLQLF